MESTYRSVIEKKWFINSGFLHNPVIPIYGFGALIILAFSAATSDWPFALQILALVFILSAFEYFTGWLMETIFKVKLWDYSGFFLNIKGRICLFNTLIWGVLSVLFLKFIHPAGTAFINLLPQDSKIYVGMTLVCVMAVDAVISTLELKVTADYVNKIARNLDGVNEQIRQLFDSEVKTRFFRKFPNLTKLIEKGIKGNFLIAFQKNQSDSVWKRIGTIMKQKAFVPSSFDQEYLSSVSDLLDHAEVKRMEQYKHHDKSTLHHALAVSQISWLLAKKFKLDSRSTARGALLHDFYLYCWRTDQVEKHATKHPERALANAVRHFELNQIEKDIIVKHMWPLTGRWFNHKESLLVSFVDKMVATVEVASMGKEVVGAIPKKKTAAKTAAVRKKVKNNKTKSVSSSGPKKKNK
jgi:uncharacterized protein